MLTRRSSTAQFSCRFTLHCPRRTTCDVPQMRVGHDPRSVRLADRETLIDAVREEGCGNIGKEGCGNIGREGCGNRREGGMWKYRDVEIYRREGGREERREKTLEQTPNASACTRRRRTVHSLTAHAFFILVYISANSWFIHTRGQVTRLTFFVLHHCNKVMLTSWLSRKCDSGCRSNIECSSNEC